MQINPITKFNKRINVSMVLLVAFVIALCLCPQVSAETAPIRQIIKVNQAVEGKPERTDYVYAILQTRGSDITDSISDRIFKLSGDSSFETSMTFETPGTYEFTVGRLKNESVKASDITSDDFYKDDNVVPINHPFGFKVTENEDGTLSVIPYTCYDNHVEFLKDGTGIVLSNLIKGPVEPTPTPTPSPSVTVTSSPKPSSNSGASDNGKGQYSPKTGDEFQMVLWASMAGISIVLILILLIVGRKKKKDGKS